MEIFCFLMGVLYLYTSHIGLPVLTLLLFFIAPRAPLILFFILGIALALAHQWWEAPKGLPEQEVIPYALIQGVIASIPIQHAGKTHFHLILEQMDHHPARGLIQLAWYQNAPVLHAGQHWQLVVTLKKPRNFANPGSYHYAEALAARHILWTGYVRSGDNTLLQAKGATQGLLRLRERLGANLANLSPDIQTTGVLQALTLNLTPQIAQEDWELFRRTGTVHLFGISGEHIALISGMIFALVRWAWARSARLCLWIPAHAAASSAGLVVAILYAFLAGFEPPVQRALVGCFFYTVACLGKQRFSAWQIWRYALFAVLCLEPHAVFMQGFYFSFLAVACLFITQQRWRLKGYKATLALQLSCLIGLMPLTLYWFSYGSVNGFIANLFAIPLVGLIIVPLALITMCASAFHWAWVLMMPLSWLVHVLFQGLLWTEYLANLNITLPITSITHVVLLMGALLLWALMPLRPLRYLAIVWLILPLFPNRTALKTGEALVQVLDVGQGLSVSVRTQHHTLLYDTGDAFFQGSDLGKMVVLPFYAATGIKNIDTIVISHPDKDHRGGLLSIQKELPVQRLLVNDPKYYHHSLNCHQFPPWEWDGVLFRFLPITEAFHDKNNSSCILKISTKSKSMLLTGDIEKAAEDYLVKTYSTELASDILIIPHHGSKTSSSYRFLLEVAPKVAIASLGFANRFHFPHTKTLKTLSTLGIPFFRTDTCGMIQLTLSEKGHSTKPRCFAQNTH